MPTTVAIDPSTRGKIRNASPLDGPELARLLGAGDAGGLLERGHLLVLDLGHGALGGAVHLDLAGPHGLIDLLVADPALAGPALEHRLSGVAHAYCEAFGCDHVETRMIAARGRR